MKQQQARDDRVERLAGAERSRVGVHELDAVGAGGYAPSLGDLEQPLGLVDAEHRTAGIQQTGQLKGHVTESGP